VKRKVRLGVIGAGWWATSNHLPLLAARDDVEFVGVCRKGADELALIRERFGFAFATEDAAELLERCELDAVIVASPHTIHYEHARAALERGLHVMVEKPMTTRTDHARELVRLADERNLHLLVPYGWHHKPFIQEAKRLLDGHCLGELQYVLCHMASPIGALLRGEPKQLDRIGGQAGESLFAPEPATWADPVIAGGGYGHAQLTHATGMLFWLTPLHAQSVFARMSAPDARVELYDAMTVNFTNGALGAVSGAGTMPRTGLPYQVDLRLFGANGMLLLDTERARLELHTHDGKQHIAEVDPASGGYECAGPPHNFIDLIVGKTEINHSPGEAALRSVELLDAAYRSAATGQVEAV